MYAQGHRADIVALDKPGGGGDTGIRCECDDDRHKPIEVEFGIVKVLKIGMQIECTGPQIAGRMRVPFADPLVTVFVPRCTRQRLGVRKVSQKRVLGPVRPWSRVARTADQYGAGVRSEQNSSRLQAVA